MTKRSIYANEKLLKNVDVVRNLVQNQELPLIHLRLYLTNECNQRCKHCFFYSSSYREKHAWFNSGQDIDYNIVKQLPEDLFALGVKGVTLSGGEPGLYPFFRSFIDDLIKYDIKVGLITNGYTLSFVHNDFAWVRVSINGYDRELYKEQHGVDEYNRRLRELEEFVRDNPDVYTGVSFIYFDSWDKHKVMSHVARLKDTGCASIRFGFYYPFINGTLQLDWDFMRSLHDDVQEIKSIYEDDSFTVINSIGPRLSIINKSVRKCYYKYISTVFTPPNRVYPCCGLMYNEKYLIGEISSSFKDFWERPETKKRLAEVHGDSCKQFCISYYKNELMDFIATKSIHDVFI